MIPSIDQPLHLLPGTLGIARMTPEAALPEWARDGVLWAAVRSRDELSIVCEERYIPPEVRAERGWRALQIEGPLDFSMLGVLAAIASVLAEAGVSIFVLSTYDTDTILVKEIFLDRALAALRGAGYLVFEPVDLGG
jgi:hypothetical protein